METILRTLFRSDAVTFEATPTLVNHQLLPEEREYIAKAVPKRRAEFGTARIGARRGLAAMGVAPTALVPAPDRSPVWPLGVVGSITHTREYCAVVLHRSPPMRSVGLDAEVLRPLDRDLSELIVSPAERRWIDARRDVAADDLMVLFFSAKEAYYKCQYPISKTMLDFHDVRIDVNLAAHRFQASAVRSGLPTCVARLEGRYAFDQGMVLCGVELAM